jgi:serine/threonine protein kinase
MEFHSNIFPYSSPEMCEGKEYDEKSDIWALGCILGEMCLKQKTFAASNLSELVSKIMTVILLAFQI